MTHKSSSRQGGGGGKIQTLELTAPVAITAGSEYFLTPEGSLVTQADISPFIATPLVGSNLTPLGAGQSWGAVGLSPAVFYQHGPVVSPIAALAVTCVQLSAQYEAYVTRPATNFGYVTCYVYDKLTGELVAEGLFTLGDGATAYPRTQHWIAIVPSGANKFCLLLDYTANSGSTYNYRVGEITFNGTNAVSFAWKTALGTAQGFQGIFCGQGTGVSAGKVAVKRDTTYSIINVVANTINSAAGFTGQHHVEGQWGLSFTSTTQVSVTNYETNGSSSFTVTGAAMLNGDTGLKLTPTVYLQGLGQISGGANQLRLVVFNPTYTAAVCTVINHPMLPELTGVLVLQPKSGALEFVLTSGGSKDSNVALSFSINSSGAVVKAAKVFQLDAATRSFTASVNHNGMEPLKLDLPIWHIAYRQQAAGSWASLDEASALIVKFRPDFYLGQYKPKYLGRALSTVAQGALASFAASPNLLAVDPAQTAFQRVGRVIKVNDLQGFFFDYNVAQLGVAAWTVTTSNLVFNQLVDASGLNYPWIAGQLSPAENGTCTIVGPVYDSAAQYTAVIAITATGVNYMQLYSPSAGVHSAIELKFSGFIVLAMRVDSTDSNKTHQVSLTLEAQEADYV